MAKREIKREFKLTDLTEGELRDLISVYESRLADARKVLIDIWVAQQTAKEQRVIDRNWEVRYGSEM